MSASLKKYREGLLLFSSPRGVAPDVLDDPGFREDGKIEAKRLRNRAKRKSRRKANRKSRR